MQAPLEDGSRTPPCPIFIQSDGAASPSLLPLRLKLLQLHSPNKVGNEVAILLLLLQHMHSERQRF